MSGDDQVCALQCAKRGTVQEFEGPVKLIIVEPPYADVQKAINTSGLTGLAQLLIGASVITTLYFSYICRLPIFISTHIVTCTTGYGLLLPSAILMLNTNFGGSMHLTSKQRKSQHAYLTYLGTFMTVTGGLHIMSYIVMSAFPYNAHTISGLATLGLTIATYFCGPVVYYSDHMCTTRENVLIQRVKYFHAALGLTTLVASSFCMCTAYWKPSFQKWSEIIQIRELSIILTCFIAIYTAIIMFGINWKLKHHDAIAVPNE